MAGRSAADLHIKQPSSLLLQGFLGDRRSGDSYDHDHVLKIITLLLQPVPVEGDTPTGACG